MKFTFELVVMSVAMAVGGLIVSSGMVLGFIPIILSFFGCGIICYIQGYSDGKGW